MRTGAVLPPPVRTVTAGGRRLPDAVDPDRLHAQYADGATLVLNALHRTHPPLVRFCGELATELGHPTQCNAYVTPGGDARGFAFHHDTHDVFVLQVAGRKRWVVHDPVLPSPLRSQSRSGDDLVAAGTPPLLDVELTAGDALYLPRGYVHAAATTDEPSVHLTVGVSAITWHDLLAEVLELAADDVRFRQSLPVPPQEALADLPAFLREAAGWLAALPAGLVRDRVAGRLDRAVPVEPLRPLAQADAVRALGPATPLRPRRGLHARLEDRGAQVALLLPDRVVAMPAAVAPALRRLLAGPATPSDLGADGLDEPGALVLTRRLLREAVLVPA